ncbi:MAG: right-handed parallel beta-helix repeat-containing protein [Bacteroidota bacterium]
MLLKISLSSSILLTASFLIAMGACRTDKQKENREGVDYYINSNSGDDANKGLSPSHPLKTLERIQSAELGPGDRILLASGQRFRGSLVLKDVSGTVQHPVIVSSYTEEVSTAMPLINATGYANAVVLENCSHVEVKNLALTADGGGETGDTAATNSTESDMRCGVLVKITREGSFTGIRLENLAIKDIFHENRGFERPEGEVRTANGTQRYGWGIRLINKVKNACLTKVEIRSCTIENVSHTGIKLTSRTGGENGYGIQDFTISGNRVLSVGGPGIQMSGVSNGYISENLVDGSGNHDDSRKWGRGSGLWTWGSRDIVIEKNRFLNARGPGDSAGAHIDFNCSNVVLQYNFSANNAGGFCEILGNNHNCAYRYNVSVNDGHRIKGQDGAFQEGKTFWLSGYQGRGRKRSGPFNSYFYNNTIFTGSEMVSKFAVSHSASGVLIANNIFHIEGASKGVLGDQYQPDRAGSTGIPHVIFENNLYFERYSWPEEVLIQDISSMVGDPGFMKPGGPSVEDYIPANSEAVKDRGVVIRSIPGDTIGLTIGLAVTHDILGNEIKDAPDMGAIEIR